ncbi:hypothetical protein L7F22_043048 [Adiantum nelumboides]|nr:hypothetical protein [Adiantum nelumboides]
MANPGRLHWDAVKSIMRYLKGTKNKCLCYGKGPLELKGFCDSDMAGDVDTQKSTSGYVFTLAGGAVSWCSKLQKIIALSTTEVEYISATEASKEAIWLARLCSEFGLPDKAPMLGCDSQSAICLAKNAMFHARTKHIDVRYHFIREVLEDGLITLVKRNDSWKKELKMAGQAEEIVLLKAQVAEMSAVLAKPQVKDFLKTLAKGKEKGQEQRKEHEVNAHAVTAEGEPSKKPWEEDIPELSSPSYSPPTSFSYSSDSSSSSNPRKRRKNSLPSQLPSERPEDHAIDLVPGSSPPNRPPYRMFPMQEEEVLPGIINAEPCCENHCIIAGYTMYSTVPVQLGFGALWLQSNNVPMFVIARQLKIEISNLSQIIDQGTGLSVGQEQELNDLVKQKEDACRERDQQLTHIVQLRKDITELNEKVRITDEQKVNLEHELNTQKDQIASKKADCEREMKKKERLEKEIRELKVSLEGKQAEVKGKEQEVLGNQEQVEKMEHQLREQKQLTDKVQKEFDAANQKFRAGYETPQ